MPAKPTIDKPLADFRAAHKTKTDAHKAVIAAQKAFDDARAAHAKAEEDCEAAKAKFVTAAIA